MREIRVELADRGYPIRIGAGILEEVGDFLLELARPTQVVVISDETVGGFYGERVVSTLRRVGLECTIVTIPPGETSKSLEVAGDLYTALLKRGIDRKSVVVALGGGVVGDLAGFVAATVLRGIDFLQVPTSLLAQVDSSVGGKTGINHPLGKNLIGAFHQPIGVLIDPTTLRTLERGEFVAGLAEVVKTAMIRDKAFFEFLEGNASGVLEMEEETLAQAVARCCRIKAEVVAADPEERTGLRAILNYGHTVGHAVEAVGRFQRYRHGEAVAVGMVVEAKIALQRGLIDRETFLRQRRLLQRLGLPTWAEELHHPQLIEAIGRDKKTQAGRWRFVLPVGLGKVEVFGDVSPAELHRALEPDED